MIFRMFRNRWRNAAASIIGMLKSVIIRSGCDVMKLSKDGAIAGGYCGGVKRLNDRRFSIESRFP
jgi:hypothetical protein